ncbi:MAG: hypothetical protein A2293_02020 [Elusimicrobia bacterium RIFOXYB2_FULL_49_7]|nr:MAG: hypothetical protein A2293_02020 [Elusimicrobia bacterium RIFOXYB2_FULL_49_7]
MKNSLTLLLGLILMGWLSFSGCARKPKPEELSKLSEARLSVEAAEKKLSELREERSKLEATLESKKEELRKAEEERDAIKAKLGGQQ